MTATTAKARCETRDLILTWDKVQEGDLVLYGGRLELVTDIRPLTLQPRLLRVRFDGRYTAGLVPTDHRTAVARYIETTESSAR